jgi:hypothetical protein
MRTDGSGHRSIDPGQHFSELSWSPDGAWLAFTTVFGGNDSGINAIHLSVIDPFADDTDAHTLLFDLSDFAAPAWRD